jgi:hypothetical protein
MKAIRWASVATSSNQCSLTGRNCRGHPGGPDGGGKVIAALRNSACFGRTRGDHSNLPPPSQPLGRAKRRAPHPYRCAEKVIESACLKVQSVPVTTDTDIR